MRRNNSEITYISNRKGRMVSEREIVSILPPSNEANIELAVFEVKSRYVGYQYRKRLKTEYDARWRTVGCKEWSYRSVHRSPRAALRMIQTLKHNAPGLEFSYDEESEVH